MIDNYSYSMTMVITYSIFLIIIVLLEFFRKRDKLFDFFTIANLYFILCYIIIPLYFIFNPKNGISLNINYDEQVLLTSMYAYFFLFIGWTFSSLKIKPPNKTLVYNYKKLLKIAQVGIVITFISTILYFASLGGLKQALVSGSLTRYGIEETGEIGTFAFAAKIVNMAPFINSLLFCLLLIKPPSLNKNKLKWLYLLSLILTILIFLVGSSRGAFVVLLLMHLFIYLKLKKKVKIKPIVIVSVSSALFVQFGKQFFYASAMMFKGGNFFEEFAYLGEFRRTSEFTIVESILKEFVHPIVSLDKSFDNLGNSVPYTYFGDFFWAILRIIPQRIVSLFVERPNTISYINTVVVQDFEEASLPPGLLAHFYYSLGYIGIALGMFFYGLIGGKFNNFLLRHSEQNKIYFVFFVSFALNYGSFITNGDPNVYLYSILWPVIFLFFVYRSKLKVKKPMPTTYN